METPNNNVQTEKKKNQLYEHPWLSLMAVVATIVVSSILASNVVMWIGLLPFSSTGQFAHTITFQILTVFIFVPFVLRLPKGKSTFRQYLDDIGLTRVQPFVRLVLLAFSCYIILALSQVAASFVYRFSEGLPITWSFVRQVFDLSGDLPPGSPSLLISFPSIFEEAVFRGIVLTVFLGKYSERKAIIFSALGFGLVHLLNLASGRELVWVMGQVVWAFILGLFYGYVFVRTRSLLPLMIVHYLGNVFISSLTGYMQSRASIEMQALYGVIFSLGIVPTTLMILWTRFFVSRWLPSGQSPVSSETNVEHRRSAGWPLLMTMLALLLNGCSTSPDTRAIPPTAIPTATISPTNTPTPSPTLQQVQADDIIFFTADGVSLSGTLFVGEEKEGIGVVLAHMGAHGADQSSWTSFAEHIAGRGFGALTFNFREDRSKLDLDVRAAIGLLRDQGYQRIVCMGASMGGTACLKAAMDTDLAGVVVISSLWTTGNGPIGGPLFVSREELAQLTLPKLFVTTEKDGHSVPATMKSMYEAAPEPKAFEIFPGEMHGTDIFATPQGDEFRDLLVDFLVRLR